MMISRQRRTAL